MIKAVFFDMYNTLVGFKPEREELQQEALRKFGTEVPLNNLRKAYGVADAWWAQKTGERALDSLSDEEKASFFGEYEWTLLRAAGIDVTKEKALQIFTTIREQKYGMEVYEDVIPTLTKLKSRGLILGLITNLGREVTVTCDKIGLTPHFNFLLSSREVGAEKPDPAIFLAALERAGVQPAEAIHVGDQYLSDVKGARGVGIQPLLLDRYGLQEDVKDCPRIESLAEVEDYV